jgi:hypothetical protein
MQFYRENLNSTEPCQNASANLMKLDFILPPKRAQLFYLKSDTSLTIKSDNKKMQYNSGKTDHSGHT